MMGRADAVRSSFNSRRNAKASEGANDVAVEPEPDMFGGVGSAGVAAE